MQSKADLGAEEVSAPRAGAGETWSKGALAAWFVLFAVCAIFNTGGYRYGASDQAFYVPAILHHADPGLFPADWQLLGPQDHLNAFTGILGASVRATGAPLPWLFALLYFASLAALFAAAAGLGTRLFRSRWTVVALAFALTLRHAVALGAVNTLEGYLHPRVLAFGVGALALSAYLRGRLGRAACLVALAFVLHPTTAIWFAVWLAVALPVADRRARVPVVLLAVLCAAGAAWALLAGPLAGRLVSMDAAWLAVLASKKYLFPTQWPAGAWAQALAYPIVIGGLFALRQRRKLVADREASLVAGAAALFVVFLASLPFTAAAVAIAVQLQIPRVLWLLDLLAIAYAIWYIAEGAPWAVSGSRARAAALALVAIAVLRGGFVMFAEHRDRAVVQIDLPASDWTASLRWIASHTPKDAAVLAAPGHAWRYGTSVRVGAERDVYLEEAKDTAIAMYSRAGAMTVAERIRVAAAFDRLDADSARAFAARTGVRVLVTEHDLALPLLYANRTFRIYDVR